MVVPTLFHIARHYSTMQIETASKSKAVYMLHQRCLMLLLKAQSGATENARYRTKVQNILAQLQRSLVISDSVSRGLYYLYDYCYVCLQRNESADIGNVQAIMGVLHDAFRVLLRRPS